MTMIVTKRLADGNFVEVLPDGTTRPSSIPNDWAAADAMTEEQIMAAALADPDAQPQPEGVPPRNAWRGPHPRFLRIKLGLSPEEFAARYHIPLDQLLQWEIQKPHPDKMAQAYLRTIAVDPEGVARAVAGKQRQAAE
jgi:putative transcriptional regulator